jgi:predicted metal-dependent HD superfamily phosphohydrolase
MTKKRAFVTADFLERIADEGPLAKACARLAETQRPDLEPLPDMSTWSLICEEIVDTEYEQEHYERVVAELHRRGLSDAEIREMRLFAWRTAGWLNFEKMMWDWCGLEEDDIKRAIYLLRSEGEITTEEQGDMRAFLARYDDRIETRADRSRWYAAWRSLGVPLPPSSLFDSIQARYSEPHRAYHTLQHIGECLERFDSVRMNARFPAEVELAIWFHDAIYDTRSSCNEELSAGVAEGPLREARVPADSMGRIRALVLATKHDVAHDAGDAAIVCDVDLAILGAEPWRFDEYEWQIRREYAWVPDPRFRQKRGEWLRETLARPRIFATPDFRSQFERAARSNIRRSLKELRV